MILCIGVDAFAPSRLARLLREDPGAASQIFVPEELSETEPSMVEVRRLATLFAIKEAVFKALAPTSSARSHWREVAVRQDNDGPAVQLTGGLATVSQTLQPLKLHVTTSGCGDLVVALVIAERPDTGS